MPSRRPAKNTAFQVEEAGPRAVHTSADGLVDEEMSRMFISLLQGFFWLGEGLHSYLRACGWTRLTRPQALVVTSIVLGDRRPAQIAARLGLSRQAVHETLGRLIALRLLVIAGDVEDQRARRIEMTASGQDLLRDAERGLTRLCAELQRRIGHQPLGDAARVLASDWGAPIGAGGVRPSTGSA